MTDKQLIILIASMFLALSPSEDRENVEAQKRAYQQAKQLVQRGNALP